MYGIGSPGLDPPDGVDDADLAFDLDLLQETRHRTEQTATATTVPKNEFRVKSLTMSSPFEYVNRQTTILVPTL